MKRLYLAVLLALLLSGCVTTGYIKNTITEFPDGTKQGECEARYFGTKDSTSAQLAACGGAIRVEGAITSDVLLQMLEKALEARNGMIVPL